MKLIIILFSLFSFTWLHSYSQQISNVNFDEIKEAIQDEGSQYFYPTLKSRAENFDSTLTQTDFYYLYYGFVFQEKYNPYGNTEPENAMIEKYKKKNYEKAVSFALEALSINPVNLKTYYYLTLSYDQLGQKDKARLAAKAYYSLLGVIYNSGDGQSLKTAYVVIAVPDEYEIAKDLELEVVQQALISETDLLTFDLKSQKGRKKIKELYFNVEKPFESLSKMLKK